ncbi:hypothetical protein AMECASPLE_029377 [Ameca splendens]|uniref:Uncharacterized protein n=1 Tax=Ameca splendens TaxID=208324 RepID=A0ABV0ZRY3_9TELE
MEEIQATDIQGPHRAQEPQMNRHRDYRKPPREEQRRAPGDPPSSHSAGLQGAAATSPQALPAAVCAIADPAMDPETRDPGTHHSPSRGPTEPRGPGPCKQPLGEKHWYLKEP